MTTAAPVYRGGRLRMDGSGATTASTTQPIVQHSIPPAQQLVELAVRPQQPSGFVAAKRMVAVQVVLQQQYRPDQSASQPSLYRRHDTVQLGFHDVTFRKQ